MAGHCAPVAGVSVPSLPRLARDDEEKNMTFTTLFSGIGGSDCGLHAAGFTPLHAFEIDADIAAIGQRNTTGQYVISDICDTDFARYQAPDVLAASPVCVSFSVANANGIEIALDVATAEATARALGVWQPRAFILENVWGYRNSFSFLLICAALKQNGYNFDFWHLNAASYGVPQTRRRLILIATKRHCGHLQPPPPTHSKEPTLTLFGGLERWRGWYEAIEDLLPDLPETKFADWQLKRLEKSKIHFEFLTGTGGYDGSMVTREKCEPSFTVTSQFVAEQPIRAFVACGMANDTGESMTVRGDGEPMFTVTSQTGERQPARAFFVDGRNFRDGAPLAVRDSGEPIFTIPSSSSAERYPVFDCGRVVALTPRCLARFQSFPDSFELSGNRKLDCTGIGNAIPPLMAKAIGEHVKRLI